MSEPSQRITRLQTLWDHLSVFTVISSITHIRSVEHITITSYSRASTRSLSSERMKLWHISDSTSIYQIIAHTRSIFSLKDLNTTLNWLQAGVLNIQSDIVNYVQQEKLWQCYMNERTFLSVWNNTLEKTRKHQSQQNKIRTVITTIWQYWGDNVWKRYLNNSRITYTEVDENLKADKECRDWGLASWLVLAVVHQCLEFRT
jgi:hypothetical protein